METKPTSTPRQETSTSPTPAETVQAFRQAYTLEEVQEELWRCLQPRLLENLSAAAPDPKRTALYEHLEVLLSAVYRLPLPEATPIATALETLHAQVQADWVLLISPPE